MDKYFFDKNNGLWYELVGDYYFPCLTVPAEEPSISVWGQRYKRYLKHYRSALYNALLLSGELPNYLADIDRQKQEMLDTITRQMSKAQGITEALKAVDPMAWVGQMNSIQACAREIIDKEIIYT